jgi:hypothetical protein
VNCFKVDPSQKSFEFTLKNPHNVPARRFKLNANKECAINCKYDRGPHFGDSCILENCNANKGSVSGGFGYSYTNDTGLDGETFLTGSYTFRVKEIEVFEIS